MRLLRPYNPFIYPGGRLPGFDPSHVVLKNSLTWQGFSGVQSGANFVNLLTGKPGTRTGAPTAVINSVIGPTTFFGGGGNTDQASWTAPQFTETKATIACIYCPQATASTSRYLFNTAGDNIARGTTLSLHNGGGTSLDLANFAGGTVCGLNLGGRTTGIPYFAVLSVIWGAGGSNGLANGLLMRLDTGQITTNAVTGVGQPSGSGEAMQGNYLLGNIETSTFACVAQIAAIMYAPSFINLGTMQQWAADPWSFWYPPALQSTMFSGLATVAGGGSSFIPAWAIPSNLPVLGTGTY